MALYHKAYNRDAAVAYAEKWALSRNPAFYNFSGIGGDCTNFASQCIYAGSGVMSYRMVLPKRKRPHGFLDGRFLSLQVSDR